MDHSISKVVFAVALSAVALGQNACTDDSTTGGTPTPSEASCSSDSDCTGDMQCIANTCSTRLRNGSACSSNDMCLSGKCADGVCALIDLDPNPDPSVVKCNSNGDCARGYCVGNVCNDRVGADCVGAADCGDGLSCRGLKCTIVVDEGGACASHSAYYCRIGTCIDGTCKLTQQFVDSDGDTIPDGAERDAEGNLLTYTSPEGLVTYCFRSRDCDGDGVPDDEEPNCGGVSSINCPDADGDGYPDASEIAAGKYAIVHGLLDGRTISSVFDIVCNPNLTVKDVFDFYFELPYQGDSKDDILEFIPKVSKLDLVFNVDTTASMTEAIENVKTNIGNTIDRVRKIVPDTGFALTNFDDYPVGVTAVPAVIKNSAGTIIANAFYQMHGNATAGDLPFRVLGKVSTDAEVVTSYTQKSLFTTRHGEDGAESGAESLYQIATGVGTAWKTNSATGYWLIGVHPDGTGAIDRITKNWNGGSTPANVNAPNTWGGVDFRQSSLPVVVHTTDVYSHDALNVYNSSMTEKYSYLSYNGVVDSVVDPHYTADLVPVLRSKGIRVITLGVPSNGEACHANDLGQMTTWSRESDAVVPACAFEGACGANKCCLGTKISDPVTIGEKTDQCVLYYEAAQSDVSETVTKGVAALVKYGTYEVSTRVEGEPIAGSSKTTACFIKRVVATKYLPPPQEPEKSCNPTALPKKLNGADYDNGFENFAPGTANPNVDGARLHFTVVAQNDDCVEPTDQFQIFKAYIDVINPTTGLVFGRRQVSILVPPKALDVVN